MTNQWHLESQKRWNEMAGNWNQNSRSMWESGSRKTIIPAFTRHLSPDDGPVLDAGCGDGYGTWKLAGLGYDMTGIDFSQKMIERAESRKDDGLKLSFQQADVTALPFPDQSFTGILSVNCLEWTASPLDGLLELIRVLRPGGLLCIAVLGPTAHPRQNSYPRLYGEKAICNTMMPWEFARLAEENGFHLVDQEPVYKEGVPASLADSLTVELKQALSFLWLFLLRKEENESM